MKTSRCASTSTHRWPVSQWEGSLLCVPVGLTVVGGQMLPPRTDYAIGPEHGPSVRARLVKLLTHTNPVAKTMAGELLLALCNQNRT